MDWLPVTISQYGQHFSILKLYIDQFQLAKKALCQLGLDRTKFGFTRPIVQLF